MQTKFERINSYSTRTCTSAQPHHVFRFQQEWFDSLAFALAFFWRLLRLANFVRSWTSTRYVLLQPLLPKLIDSSLVVDFAHAHAQARHECTEKARRRVCLYEGGGAGPVTPHDHKMVIS